MAVGGDRLQTLPAAGGGPPAHAGPAPRHRRWPIRVSRWTAERHGLSVLIVVAILFALSFSAGFLQTEDDLLYGRRLPLMDMVLGGMAFWSWYLMLRALDDLQDAPADAQAHPDRMLQRGAISRRDLWALVGAALVFQGSASFLIDLGTTSWTVSLTWLAMLAFLGAAAVDFALPEFVSERPLVLRVLRTPASLLPVLWAYAMGSTDVGSTAAPLSWTTLALVGVALCTVAFVDISRRLPDLRSVDGQTDKHADFTPMPWPLVVVTVPLVASSFALLELVDASLPSWAVPLAIGLAAVGSFVDRRISRDTAIVFLFLTATAAALIGAAV